MKIIDIFNKIANGEELPKKFKYGEATFELEGNGVSYTDQDGDNLTRYICYDYSNLNDEVEIINENKIEKLSYQQIGSYLLERKDYETFTNCVNEQISKIGKKLNDMVEVVNYLLEKEK